MPQQAQAGSYHRAAVKIGHGCEGSPTTRVELEIPAGIQHAKPQPKPGWEIEINRSQLAQPYELHGKRVTEDVSRIIWSGGSLPDEYYEEFVFHAKLQDKPGTLYLPVRQVCERGEIYWHQLPADGHGGHQHGSEQPAPALELVR